MATRVVEGKKLYTGGEAIDINQNKVISLKLRDENNLIIYDNGDDEIYVDLQLPDGIEPLDAFPVGVTTGRVLVADDWDVTGTLICAKTTSGDNIKILYGDNGTLWIDNGTGTFKQIYLKSDTDALLLALRNYIDGELAKKQNGVASATAPVNPSIGDLWYDMNNDVLKVYDGSTWNTTGGGGGGGTGDVVGPNSATDGHLAVFDGATGKLIKDGGAVPEGVPSGGTDGQVLSKVSGAVAWANPSGGDVLVSTQANNIFTTGMKIWGGTKSDFDDLVEDSNTAYLILADQPTPPTPGGWQPGANTIAYYPLTSTSTINDMSGNSNTLTNNSSVTFGVNAGVDCATFYGGNYLSITGLLDYTQLNGCTMCAWFYVAQYPTGSDGKIIATDGSTSIMFAKWLSPFQYYMEIAGGTGTGVTTIGEWTLGMISSDGTNNILALKSSNIDYTNDSITANRSSLGSSFGIGAQPNGNGEMSGYVSNVIIEDKKWSVQDFLDYYNQTKGDYGIS